MGGTYGGMGGKPTPFLCLAFKMVTLFPSKDIVLEYLNYSGPEHEDNNGDDEHNRREDAKNGDVNGDHPQWGNKGKGHFKYLRALAAFYIRLTWDAVDIYQTLEPLLTDYRKLRRRLREGYALTYMDQFVDDLLTKDRMCATSLWKLPKRSDLEDLDKLEPRESPLGEELEQLEREEEEHMTEEDGGDDDDDGCSRRSGDGELPYDSRSSERSFSSRSDD